MADQRRSLAPELGGEQVEGHQAVRELLAAGRRRVHRLWVMEGQASTEPLRQTVELARRLGVPVQIKRSDALLAAAHTSAPQGVVAWADPVAGVPLDALLAAVEPSAPPFWLVLDGVTDPGNFGSILRSAVCAGVNGVIIGRRRSAPLTAAAVKAAAGAVEVVPIVQVAGVPSAMRLLAGSGVWAVGLDPTAREDLWHCPLLDGPVAMVLGSEGTGLSRLVRERCDTLARIPQKGPMGSLNVAIAAAVACFEVARRRGTPLVTQESHGRTPLKQN